MSQLLIKGGKCVSGKTVFSADVLVDDGKITAIGSHFSSKARDILDASGCYVLPGGIDVHVHMPWPTGSYVSLDDIRSGTLAAAHGGVTTVIDFAIPEEKDNLASVLERKLAEARSNAWVDYSFHLNIRGELSGMLEEIPDLVARGFPSFKIFMAYEGFRLEDQHLLRVMESIKSANGILDVHAENGLLADYLTDKLLSEGKLAPANFAESRPTICEVEAVQRILAYQRTVGNRLHIHHVSTAEGAKLIGKAGREGMPVTGETCPHYLLFSDDDYRGNPIKAASLICAPAIKSAQDQTGLWLALAGGSLSVLATDHCPYSNSQKVAHLENFALIPGGMAGVETRLPLIFSEGVLKGRISIERFVEVWATGPAQAMGLFPRKGIIAVGSDADLVILNPDQKTILKSSHLHMNSDCLPYEGWEVSGFPLTTVLRGKILVDKGKQVVSEPGGALIPRYFEDRK